MNERASGVSILRRTYAVIALAVVALGGTAVRGAPPPPSLEPHVLLQRADFERINALARIEPWAKKIRDDLVQAAETWPAQHLEEYGLKEWAPPAEGGGWSGDYICPDDGARLQFSPGHNRCPRCGKDYHGWPADYVTYLRRHVANAAAVRDLGLAFRLTGQAAFAGKARVILLAYAKLYPTMPIHSHKDWPVTGSRSGGRVTSQTLNEADWAQTMAFGYDLVRATLTPEERASVERDVLRSASEVVARRDRSLGNWTARHNAGHLAVGLAIGDAALVTLAIESEFGLRDDLRRGVSAEGQWREGSWGYHFYVMEPLFRACEMAARAGIAVPEAKRLKEMLDVALACVLPDGTLPNFNDSGFTALRDYARFFDLGYRLFGDRRYLRIVRDAPRSLDALLWGSGAVGEGALPELASVVLPEAGLAMLRAPGTDHVVAVKFGEHGGGHGHFDKLNFVSFADGHLQAVDPGTQSYAYKTHHTWDQVTVAHNTVVVDETTQAGATGHLLEWHPGEVATAVRLEAGPVYPQACLERLLIHTATYTLDVVEARATDGAAHGFDWVYHNDARTSKTSLALTPYTAFPAKNGYQYLADPRAAVTASSWEASFAQEKGGLCVHMLGASDTTVVTGTGLGQDLTVPVPFVMARRRGVATRFVAVLEPFREAPRVRAVRLVRPEVVQIQSTEGVDEIVLTPGSFSFTRVPPPAARP